MKPIKVLAAAAAVLTALATAGRARPPRHLCIPATYDLLTNRYDAGVVGVVHRAVQPRGHTGLPVHQRDAPTEVLRLLHGNAYLANGQWTLKVDVQTVCSCLPGYTLPTHETYVWDDITLAGTSTRIYDVGCFNGPPGTQFWTFALQRL